MADTVTYLQTVDSTNNYAMGRIQSGCARHGDAIIAAQQTAGKGQRGRHWLANRGENLLLSLIVEPNSLITQQFLLSAKVALSCQRVVADLTAEKVFIKWPNDIYVRDRKAGGILIENIMRSEEWRFAIVGIGLNINQTEFPLGVNGISLHEVTGKRFNVVHVAKKICAELNKLTRHPLESDNEILARYNDALYKRSESVHFRQGNVSMTAIVKSVNNWGELVLFSGIEKTVKVGEVEWIVETKAG